MLKKVVLWFSLVLILMNLASAQYYYDQSFNGFGLFSGSFDILSLYELNSTWFDFFIFLLIFLGLTQAVFGEGHFKKQSQTISIGLSLALSLGLVLWERNTGTNLLSFGAIGLLLITLLIFYIIFSILKKMGTEWWVAGAWAYVVIFVILMIIGPQFFNWASFESIFPWLNFFFYICILIGLIGLYVSNPLGKKPGTP